MGHDRTDKCAEIRSTLNDLQMQRHRTPRDTAVVGLHAGFVANEGDLNPGGASPYDDEIRALEAELRDLSCTGEDEG